MTAALEVLDVANARKLTDEIKTTVAHLERLPELVTAADEGRADDRLALEHAVVNAAVWGSQAPDLLDELERTELLDPWCRDVVAVVVELWRRWEPGSLLATVDPMEVAARVEALGWRPGLSPSIVLAEVTGEGYSIEALPLYLHRLREMDQRRAVMARLVALADTAERPGGASRVAEVLGMGVMA